MRAKNARQIDQNVSGLSKVLQVFDAIRPQKICHSQCTLPGFREAVGMIKKRPSIHARNLTRQLLRKVANRLTGPKEHCSGGGDNNNHNINNNNNNNRFSCFPSGLIEKPFKTGRGRV